MKAFLNVGGGNKQVPVPGYYAGWRHDLLDIDPASNPDILMDARNLHTLPPSQYDAIYCSHNLEHYHHHDALKVLRGFRHLLKEDGFVELRVPDIQAVMRHAVQNNLDVEDVLYVSNMGPILVRDVLYGHQGQIERSGVDFYQHRTGFSPRSLGRMIREAGFEHFGIGCRIAFEMLAYAFRQSPSPEQKAMLGVDVTPPSITPPGR